MPTTIAWTQETWNPVTGCDEVSPGCDRCYAKTFAERWRGIPGHPYEHGFDVMLRPERLDQPLRWTRPRMIFVNSMSDLFHDLIPDQYIAQVFAVMALARRHTFQLLTKRHGRMRSLLSRKQFHRDVADAASDIIGRTGTYQRRRLDLGGMRAAGDSGLGDGWTTEPVRGGHTRWVPPWPLPNVWLGVSVEDQKRANLRIPALLDTPASVRWLSMEPLLGPVDLHAKDTRTFGPRPLPAVAHGVNAPDHRAGDGSSIGSLYATMYGPNLDWIVCGGESGPGARPMQADWALDLAHQCRQAGVPYFFKQLGSVLARQLGVPGKGEAWETMPEQFRIRDYPAAVAA
jgi:protein gp37